jgi:hypothetical protein
MCGGCLSTGTLGFIHRQARPSMAERTAADCTANRNPSTTRALSWNNSLSRSGKPGTQNFEDRICCFHDLRRFRTVSNIPPKSSARCTVPIWPCTFHETKPKAQVQMVVSQGHLWLRKNSEDLRRVRGSQVRQANFLRSVERLERAIHPYTRGGRPRLATAEDCGECSRYANQEAQEGGSGSC